MGRKGWSVMKCLLCDGSVVNGRCSVCGMPFRKDEIMYHLNESSRDHYRHATPKAKEMMRKNRVPLGDKPESHKKSSAGGTAKKTVQSRSPRKEAVQPGNSGNRSYQTGRNTSQKPEGKDRGKKKSRLLTKLIWLMVILWVAVPTLISLIGEVKDGMFDDVSVSSTSVQEDSGQSYEYDEYSYTRQIDAWESEDGSKHYLIYAGMSEPAEVGKEIEPGTYWISTSEQEVTLTVRKKSDGKEEEYTLAEDDYDLPDLKLEDGDILFVSDYEKEDDYVYLGKWNE